MLLIFLLLVCAANAESKCDPAKLAKPGLDAQPRSFAVAEISVKIDAADNALSMHHSHYDKMKDVMCPFNGCAHVKGPQLPDVVLTVSSYGRLSESKTSKTLFLFRALLQAMRNLVSHDAAFFIEGDDKDAFLFDEINGKACVTGTLVKRDKQNLNCPPGRQRGHACTVVTFAAHSLHHPLIQNSKFEDALFQAQDDKTAFLAVLDAKIAEIAPMAEPVFYIDTKGLRGEPGFYAEFEGSKRRSVFVQFTVQRDLIVYMTSDGRPQQYVYHAPGHGVHIFLCHEHRQCVRIDRLPRLAGWLPLPGSGKTYKLSVKSQEVEKQGETHSAIYVIAVAVEAEAMASESSGRGGTVNVAVETAQPPMWGMCFDKNGKASVVFDQVPGQPAVDSKALDGLSTATLKISDKKYHHLQIYAAMANDDHPDSCRHFESDFRVIETFHSQAASPPPANYFGLALDRKTNSLYLVRPATAIAPQNFVMTDATERDLKKGVVVANALGTLTVTFVENNKHGAKATFTVAGKPVTVRKQGRPVSPVYVLYKTEGSSWAQPFFDFSEYGQYCLALYSNDADMVLEPRVFPMCSSRVIAQDQRSDTNNNVFVAMNSQNVFSVTVCAVDASSALQCRVLKDKIDLTPPDNAEDPKSKKKNTKDKKEDPAPVVLPANQMLVELPTEWAKPNTLDYDANKSFFFFDDSALVKKFPLDDKLRPEDVLDCHLMHELVKEQNRLKLGCKYFKTAKDAKSAVPGKPVGGGLLGGIFGKKSSAVWIGKVADLPSFCADNTPDNSRAKVCALQKKRRLMV